MRYLLLVVITIFSIDLSAQMEVNGETLYGNEWIDYEKSYAKIIVDTDGIYRITRQELADNGISVNTISFDKLHMWNYGKEVGFFIGPNDSYIEFFAEKNKIQLDRFLYDNEDHILNRNYSFVSDDAAYFITWTNETNSLVFEQSEVNLNGNTITPEQFYMHKEEVISNLVHYKPTLGDQVRYSNFVSSEGYGTGLRATNTLSVPINYKSSSNVEGQVYIRFGGNNVSHRTDITINGEDMGQISSIRDTVQILNLPVSSDLIGNDKVDVTVAGTIMSNNTISDKNTISEVSVTYPREFHMGGADMHTISLSPSVSKRYIELDGYNGSELPIIYDMQNATRILPELLGDGKIGILVDPSSEANTLHLCDPSSGLFSAKGIKRREFISYADRTDAEFLMISSEGLRNQDNIDWVQEYADYRSSMTGGGLVTSLVDVEQLYDQFAYGVDRHFISLKNYVHWTAKNYDDPKFLFIIGKGIEYPNIRKDSSIQEATNFQVPTWGNPGSDNILMTTKDSPVPIFPIGRLAAGTSYDVRNYLDKVRDHEQNVNNPSTIKDRSWQKEVLHLSGGGSTLGENLFIFLEEMRDTLENNKYGANVSTFRKESTDAIEFATDDLIFENINNGVSLITFFGHASSNAFDFNLDNVENYNNKDKYFLLMSLGCYSGNIHTLDGGISESFVLSKDRGAIAFLAASGTAYVTVQKRFGTQLYSELGGPLYGKSVGEAVVKVIDEFKGFTDFGYVTFYQQLTFHGDPSLKLPNFSSPDYIPDATTVVTDPKFVDTYEDDFELCFDVVNVGSSVRDSFSLKIEHFDPKGEISTDTIIRMITPMNTENYCVRMPIVSNELVGKNIIKITVDALNEINEFPSPDAELNNVLVSPNGIEGFEFYVLNNSAVPIYPREYDIVNGNDISLISSTYNALGAPQNFVMQIDTISQFDSPNFKQKIFTDAMGTIQWNLDFSLDEKTVYYWRVSPDSLSTGLGNIWSESSFVYDTGAPEGWNQSHFYQYQKNDYENMNLNPNRKFSFVTNLKQILIANKVWESELPAQYIIDNGFKSSMMDRNTAPSIGVAVIDTVGKFLMNPIGGEFGSINLKNKPIRTFYFKMDEQQGRIDLVNFLENVIPDRQFVTVYNIYKDINTNFKVEEWAQDSIINNGKNIFNVLEAEGAIEIRRMQAEGIALPYGFIYKKGISALSEGIAEDINASVDVMEDLPGFWFEGSIMSDFVGPARSWSNIVWEPKQSSIMPNDTTFIRVHGYDSRRDNGVLLIDSIKNQNFDISNIDASIYPYLKLQYYTKDVDDVSPVQLDKWRVYYEGIGDLTLNTAQDFSFHADSLQQGDQITLKFNVDNFSSSTVNPTKIKYSIVDSENNVNVIEDDLPEIKSKATEEVSFSYDTRNLIGAHQLQVEINQSRDPSENYYFNNFGLEDFTVYPDTTNPILEVTFDGVVIMDQDIVSSNPLINIKLTDENKFIFLEHPENFTLLLSYPSNEVKEVDVNDQSVNFYTDNSDDKNNAWIEFNPELLEDGEYKLVVEARDESSNSSGSQAYEVRFRVFNEEMVSNVFNYPNPFSTSTQFIFTLTGNEEPGNILIRVMTLTGKVVREITSAELGQLRIGVNKTDYKWDGTDEYGEKLGNGVYLYQVITKKLDGTNYEKFTDETQNNTDYLFRKGFGKLVIMR